MPVPVQSSHHYIVEACATPFVYRMCSFLILPLRVTRHIHRSILISFTPISFSYVLVVAHVSSPYSIAGRSLFCITSLQFRRHPSVAQYFIAFLPISASCTHPLCDLRFHTTLFFYTRFDVLEMSNYFHFHFRTPQYSKPLLSTIFALLHAESTLGQRRDSESTTIAKGTTH